MVIFRSTVGWQKNLIWLLFAVLFFFSGQSFTIWLLEPENFSGGYRWLLVFLFPVLLPAFFYINYKFGCASGACARPPAMHGKMADNRTAGEFYHRPPGG